MESRRDLKYNTWRSANEDHCNTKELEQVPWSARRHFVQKRMQANCSSNRARSRSHVCLKDLTNAFLIGGIPVRVVMQAVVCLVQPLGSDILLDPSGRDHQSVNDKVARNDERHTKRKEDFFTRVGMDNRIFNLACSFNLLGADACVGEIFTLNRFQELQGLVDFGVRYKCCPDVHHVKNALNPRPICTFVHLYLYSASKMTVDSKIKQMFGYKIRAPTLPFHELVLLMPCNKQHGRRRLHLALYIRNQTLERSYL